MCVMWGHDEHSVSFFGEELFIGKWGGVSLSTLDLSAMPFFRYQRDDVNRLIVVRRDEKGP